MDEQTTRDVAALLEKLADQETWNPEVWQRCHDLVKANWDNELLAFVYDDVVQYSGEFHAVNLLGFRVKPHADILEDYRYEFRSVAAALRAGLSLAEAKKRYGIE